MFFVVDNYLHCKTFKNLLMKNLQIQINFTRKLRIYIKTHHTTFKFCPLRVIKIKTFNFE